MHIFCVFAFNFVHILSLIPCFLYLSIGLDQVCDGHSDCTDKSDEIGCHNTRFDKTYLDDVPPPALHDSEDDHELLQIGVNLDLKSILEFDPMSSLMKVGIVVRVEWTEERLKFYHLKENQHFNQIYEFEKPQLWMPTLIFTNTQSNMKVSFQDEDSHGSIRKKDTAKSYLSDLSHKKNAKITPGSDW